MSNSIALLALEAADGTVVLTSITLVFAMLVALCLIITVEGKIFDAIKNKKNGTKAAPKAPAAPAARAKTPQKTFRHTFSVQLVLWVCTSFFRFLSFWGTCSFFSEEKKEPKKTAAVSTQRTRDLGAARPRDPQSGSRKERGLNESSITFRS